MSVNGLEGSIPSWLFAMPNIKEMYVQKMVFCPIHPLNTLQKLTFAVEKSSLGQLVHWIDSRLILESKYRPCVRMNSLSIELPSF